MTDEIDQEIDEDIKEEINEEIDEVIKQQADELVEQMQESAGEKQWLSKFEDDLRECRNVAYKIDRLYPDMFAVAGIYYLYQRIDNIVGVDSMYAGEDRPDIIDEIISDHLYETEAMLLQATLLFEEQLMERDGAKDIDRFDYKVGQKIIRTINNLEKALETCTEALDELEDLEDADADNVNK